MNKRNFIILLNHIIDNTNKTKNFDGGYCLQNFVGFDKIITDDDVLGNLRVTIGQHIYTELFKKSYRPKEIWDAICNISKTLNLLMYADHKNKLCVNKKDLNKLLLMKKIIGK